MLSLTLSRIFSVCFVLALLGGTIAVSNQLADRPFKIPFGGGWRISLGQGLEVPATAWNQSAMPTDTAIKAVLRDSNNHRMGSSLFAIGGPHGSVAKTRIKQMLALSKAEGVQCHMDTFYTVMGQNRLGGFSGPAYQIDDSPRARTGFLPDSGIISRKPLLVFADAGSANRYFHLRGYSFRNKISGDAYSTATLRIWPADKWQQMSFAVHELVKFGCISLLFLFLSRLFRNFSKKNFFTPVNIRLLQYTGCLMLAPPFVTTLLHFSFLQDLMPVKFVMDQNAEISSMITYDVTLNINWMLITVGVSLLVLAYIFHDGLEMKEEALFTA